MTMTPRVGFITYGTDRARQGVTRVALELGQALNRSGKCQLVRLMAEKPVGFRVKTQGSSWTLPGCGRLPGLMVLGGPLIALAARRLRLDIVHDPIGISPFTLGRWAGSFARIVTLHDATAYRYPQGYPWLNNFLNQRYIPATLNNVDAVITDSNFSRADLHQFLRVPAERSFVVPLGVGPNFHPPQPARALHTARRYGLTAPYVLSVGAQQARKNLAGLVNAFAQLHARRPDYQLAIVGPTLWRHTDLRQQVVRLKLDGAVSILGYVPDDDLPSLYGAAAAFVLPSLFEGFGLPVLEAMACGTPVVCSNATSLPEVAGDAALLVHPQDLAGMAAAIEQLLTDSNFAARLRQRGLDRASQFSWDRTAQGTLAVYDRVLTPQ